MLTSAFAAAVRRQGSIPNTYSTTDILGVADGEIQSVFIPLLESVRQNFLVREIIAVPDARGRVPLPNRSVVASARNVQLQVGNGWRELPMRAMEEADSMSSGPPAAYYMDAGSIVLLPSGSSGTLRIRYVARPGAMVLDTATTTSTTITGVTIVGDVVTLALGAFTGTGLMDILSGGPAHQAKLIDGVMTGFTVPLSSCIEAPAVGDRLATSGNTPFVPLPEELSAALMHRTAGVILQGLAYLEEASAQLSLANEAIARAVPMLTPRNEGNPQRIVGGLARALRTGRRGRWG